MPRVLITASTSSIGQQLVQTFAEADYQVIAHYHSNKHLSDSLSAKHSTKSIQADLTNADQVAQFVSQALNLGPFDVVINNAGIGGSDNNIEGWQQAYLLNVIVPALLLEQHTSLLHNQSCVVNVSSIYGDLRYGYPEMLAYSASKAALNNLTTTYAKIAAPRSRVNAIAPGYVDSKWNADYSPADKERLKATALTQQLVTSQEVAELALHLANNKSINGQIITIDGGQTLKSFAHI